jgi:hypothetical protein
MVQVVAELVELEQMVLVAEQMLVVLGFHLLLLVQA